MEEKKIEIGKWYSFLYPDYGTPDSHPDYTAHRGSSVKVLRELTDKEVDPINRPMYEVQAKDGWKGSVNAFELFKKLDFSAKGPFAQKGDREEARDSGMTVRALRIERAMEELL